MYQIEREREKKIVSFCYVRKESKLEVFVIVHIRVWASMPHGHTHTRTTIERTRRVSFSIHYRPDGWHTVYDLVQ